MIAYRSVECAEADQKALGASDILPELVACSISCNAEVKISTCAWGALLKAQCSTAQYRAHMQAGLDVQSKLCLWKISGFRSGINRRLEIVCLHA